VIVVVPSMPLKAKGAKSKYPSDTGTEVAAGCCSTFQIEPEATEETGKSLAVLSVCPG
jgi:hypothetical protein